MFEAAEVGRKVSSEDYKAQVSALREDLLGAQLGLREDRRRRSSSSLEEWTAAARAKA